MHLGCGQSPPRKSEDELREEEELQLALALSKSEAEHKEKEVTTAFILFILLIPVNICSLVMFSVWSSAASYVETSNTSVYIAVVTSISYLFSAAVTHQKYFMTCKGTAVERACFANI
jgi:hypothetical protein